jgi:putative phosphoribosyl transferase
MVSRTPPNEVIMRFSNRTEAGRALAERLSTCAGRDDLVVLGVPRGGVPVAFEVASALRAPLDVFILRKLGVPGHEELAFGAIASGGVRVVDLETVRMLGISNADMEAVYAREGRELERREHAYRRGRPALAVAGRSVILVDDGIATGSSMRAAIVALRKRKPAFLTVAVPVAPPRTYDELRSEVDDLVCLETPEFFEAVGQFYDDFSQVTDEEVRELLHRAAQSRNGKAA